MLVFVVMLYFNESSQTKTIIIKSIKPYIILAMRICKDIFF